MTVASLSPFETHREAAGGNPDGLAAHPVINNVILFYVGAVALAGAGMILYSILTAGHVDLVSLAVFCVAAAAAERFKLATSADSPVAISLSLAVVLAAVAPFGPLGAASCGLAAGLAAGLFRKPRPELRKTAFNSGLFVLAGGAAAIAYHAVLGPGNGERLTLNAAAASGAALVTYFIVAWPLLVGIVHLTTGRPVRQIWSEDFRWMPIQIGVSAIIGFTIGAAYTIFSWVGIIVYITPLLAVRESMRQYTSHVARQMDELRQAHAEADEANRKLVKVNQDLDVTNEGLLKTLASVIDARDIYLYGHSVQASKYAGEVARIMGLDAEQVRITELGALLHDLGKIGVSEAILNKPARLTDAEYEEIKAHCEIGYHLLSNLPQFEEVAEIVYSHHEDYDGTGYPRKLKGEDIPIGARIVSVVEATEAMISDRPYRRGMTPDEVLTELANGAGTQWDPDVVRIFSGMLSADRKHLKMRNSALEVALSRTPIVDLVSTDEAPSLEGVTATFHGALQPIFILDQDYGVVTANPAAERVTGLNEAQLQERTWAELAGTDLMQRDAGHNFFSSARVIHLQRAGGDTVDLEVTGTPLRTNSASYWMVLANDVTARRRQKEANVGDPLTGLATRAQFEAEVRSAQRELVEPLTIVTVDIDSMGPINETFGRDTGDQAMVLMARVLRSQLRQGDMAARLDGDLFAILMRRASLQDAGRVVQRVEDALPGAAIAFDLDCVVEFCSGAAQWNARESYEELLARAQLWMEAEKRSRKPGPVIAMPVAGDRRRPRGEDQYPEAESG